VTFVSNQDYYHAGGNSYLNERVRGPAVDSKGAAAGARVVLRVEVDVAVGLINNPIQQPWNVEAYRAEPGFQPLPAVKSPTFCQLTLYWPAAPLVYVTVPPPLLQN
jgi:hypothetical protein